MNALIAPPPPYFLLPARSWFNSLISIRILRWVLDGEARLCKSKIGPCPG